MQWMDDLCFLSKLKDVFFINFTTDSSKFISIFFIAKSVSSWGQRVIDIECFSLNLHKGERVELVNKIRGKTSSLTRCLSSPCPWVLPSCSWWSVINTDGWRGYPWESEWLIKFKLTNKYVKVLTIQVNSKRKKSGHHIRHFKFNY